MSKRWVKVSKNEYARPTEDGKVEVRRVEQVGPLLKRQKARRQKSRRKPMSTEEGGLREIARMAPGHEHEMVDECGEDPDKQRAFLREHPELLSVDEKDAHLPKKKVRSFPSHMRSDTDG